MSDNGERVGSTLNPPHLGELIRESMDELGLTVTETVSRARRAVGAPMVPRPMKPMRMVYSSGYDAA